MSVTVKAFDKLRDGRIANLYTIENQKGMKAVLTDFGAVLVKLLVPDQDGKLRDVVLGYDELEKYEDNFDMLGTTVGRNVNRIEKGRFTIDGVEYQLEINENDNNIHSSMAHGFHKVLWEAESFTDDSVSFTYHSPDMENGFPGNLDISLTYTLTDTGALILSYYGTTDKKTLVNLTNHSYFNLSGRAIFWIPSCGSTQSSLHRCGRESFPPGKSAMWLVRPWIFGSPGPSGRRFTPTTSS